MNTLTGWLAVDWEPPSDVTWGSTSLEFYADGPHLGQSTAIAQWLEQFDGKRIELTVRLVEESA